MADRSAQKQSPLKALLSIEKTIRKGTLCAKYCLKYYCLRRLASSFFLWRQNARVMTILLSVNSSNGNNIALIPNGNGDTNSIIMSKSELIGSKSINSGVVMNYPVTPSESNNNNTYNNDNYYNNNIDNKSKNENVELTMEQRRQNVLMYAKQILSQTRMNPTTNRSKPRSKGSFSSSSAGSPASRVFMDTEASKSRSYSHSGEKKSRAISPASVETYRSRKSDTAIAYRRNSWGHYTDNSSISRRGRSGGNSDSRGRRSLSSESKSSTVRAKSVDSKGSVVSSASKFLSHTQSSRKKTATIAREKKSQRRTYSNYGSDNNGNNNNNYNYYDHIVSRNIQEIDRAQMELFRVGYSENKKNTKGWRDSLRL